MALPDPLSLPRTRHARVVLLVLAALAAVAAFMPVDAQAAKPKISAAFTLDKDGDGRVDGVTVRFSVPVRGTPKPSAFRVKGLRVLSAAKARGKRVALQIAEGSGLRCRRQAHRELQRPRPEGPPRATHRPLKGRHGEARPRRAQDGVRRDRGRRRERPRGRRGPDLLEAHQGPRQAGRAIPLQRGGLQPALRRQAQRTQSPPAAARTQQL